MPVRGPACRAVERCRICRSDRLEEVISLGDQYVASLFPHEELTDEVARRYPLDVVRCSGPDGCGLVQLRHTVAPEILYDHYGYRSGTNELMRKNLAEIASQIEELVEFEPGDVVVDVGCNDGTLLKSYHSSDLRRIGIDPSDAVEDIGDPGIEVIREFFSAAEYAGKVHEKAKVVTTIAMFYDLDDPHGFVADVADVLDDRGLWVIEMQYLPLILEMTAFDAICHEHLEYYTLAPVERLLADHGLRVFRADLNDVNGGSIRLFVGRPDAGYGDADTEANIERLRSEERRLKLATDEPYAAFRARCSDIRDRLSELLHDLKGEGRTVYVYGASTKGNTVLQFCGVDTSLVAKAADRSPAKWGAFTVGSNIPIISEEQARAEKPDYFLVLPWHFFSGFVEREREFLRSGGRFILPLPTVRIVGQEDV